VSKVTDWSYEEYELLQVVLTREFEAVYAGEKDGDGLHPLTSWRVDAIGVARVTTRYVVGEIGKRIHRVVRKTVVNEIVGLEFEDGYWQVCNEASNFAGLMKSGGDIREATGCLNVADYPLQKQFEMPDSK
jgi:hypothetical protein